MIKKKNLLIFTILIILVITTCSLVGCAGSKITEEEYKNIVSLENVSKITDYRYSIIYTEYVPDGKKDKESKSIVVTQVVDGNKAKIVYTTKTTEEKNGKVVINTRVDEYVYDFENKLAYYKWTENDKQSEKYEKTEENKFIDSALIQVATLLNATKFSDLKLANGKYVIENKEDKKNPTPLRIAFTKNSIKWLSSIEVIKEKDHKKSQSQMVFETGDQKVKIPSGKQVA